MKVRIEQHEKNALEIAKWLENHPGVSQVLHPALPSHPQHDLWKRDFGGATGLFGFALKDATLEQAGKFLDVLKLFGKGYSWGGYESLAVVVNLSDRTISKGPETGRLIRLQIGLEDTKDLMADIDQAITASGVV